MIKITKQEYEQGIKVSGFKCRNPISHSGKNNKYYYIVETDYENYQKFIKNKNRLGAK
nr:MAG TPA: Triabin [Caudoviricetes sp.]